MMPSPFDLATQVERERVSGDEGDDRVFSWAVPDGWQQARGAWGGLAVGALTRAVVATDPDRERVVRSVSVQMSAPVLVATHRIAVRPVRRGSSLSTWSAIATDPDGTVVASMVAITGRPRTPVRLRDRTIMGTAVAPTAPPAEAVAVLAGPPLPVFTQHCEFRPISGLPLSGSAPASTGWIRLSPSPSSSAASLLALVDAWWPASLPIVADMPRVSTVNFTANLLVDPASVPSEEPLLNESFVAAGHEGFTSEHRRLWTRDGRLAVDNLQTMVIGA